MPAPYPALIGHRMAYDRTAQAVFSYWHADTTPLDTQDYTIISLPSKRELNNEDDDIGWSFSSPDEDDHMLIGMTFPEPYDIIGYFAVNELGAWIALEYSKNATTGTNGTWETVIFGEEGMTGCHTDYVIGDTWRTDPAVLETPITGVRAIRFRLAGGGTQKIHVIHFYGKPSVTATPDRLKFWHPTADLEAPPEIFEWLGCPRRSSEDKYFRIKNASSSEVAFAVSMAVETMTFPVTGPQPHQTLLLSEDGGLTFSATLVIGTLAPGEVSSVMILRRVTPLAMELGLWTARIFVTAAGGFKDDEEYIYFEDISTDVPTPHLWFLYPNSGYRGDTVWLYGYGFGDNAAEYDGVIQYGVEIIPEVTWGKVNGTGAQFGVDRVIQSANANVNVEHQRISVEIPLDAEDSYFTVRTDA